MGKETRTLKRREQGPPRQTINSHSLVYALHVDAYLEPIASDGTILL